MAYTIYKTNGQYLTTVADGTINRGSTSIALPGRNFSGYGLYIDQNLVQMVENFAGNTVPTNAIIGQLWWDTSVPGGIMRICLADGDTNPATWGELALGGVGANASFGNIFAENIYGNVANLADLNVSNTINASNVFVGSDGNGLGNLSLFGANGHIDGVSATFTANVKTPVLDTGPSGSGTLNNNWSVTGDLTVSGNATVQQNLTFSGSIATFANTANFSTINANTINSNTATIGNANVTTFLTVANGSVTGNLGVGNGTFSNLTVTQNSNLNGNTSISGNFISSSPNSRFSSDIFQSTGTANLSALNVRGTSNISGAATFGTNITQSSGTAALRAVTATSLSVSGSSSLTGGFDAGAASSVNGVLTVYGEIRAAGSDIVAFYSSDRRLKENIRPIENALDSLDKINGVRYDWTDEYLASRDPDPNPNMFKKADVGVIAQEIEQVLPELVIERDNGYKAVKYEKIIALLIQAVKELKAEVQQLKDK